MLGIWLLTCFLIQTLSVDPLVVGNTINDINEGVSNLSPEELNMVLNQLINPSPQYQMHAAALRNQLRNLLLERDLSDTPDEDTISADYYDYLEEDKRSVAALAAQGLLQQHRAAAAAAAKRGLATLAKNGQLPTPDPELLPGENNNDAELHTNDKRRVDVLARSGDLINYGNGNGNGKRNIGTLARDYQLPQFGKRNLATMARLGLLGNRYEPKRNLASVARYNSQRFAPGATDKRNLAALKASAVHAGLGGNVGGIYQQKRNENDANEDDIYIPAVYNYMVDPFAYYWDYGTYADMDWGDDYRRAQKRYLGRVLPPTRATASTHRSRL